MNTSNLVSTPSIPRRFAACLYEFVLLFGIYFITGGLIQVLFTLIGQKTPIWFTQLVIFLMFGFYFTYSWRKAGHTLAQKTWHIQVVQLDGKTLLTNKQAWLRYILSYFGVLPALLLLYTQIHGQISASGDNATAVYIQTIGFLSLNCVALLGTALMNSERRTIHEVLSETRSVYFTNKNSR
ncbi:RDD family protein [Hydromonas duriensis]|uniref:RDD family protein n=1 Tax=Hydromonas duriensis TaxID=1527608 RepID=A0A4V3DK30_9BURK|nr:RDD family protein [Hydromonas duriensis]TDR32406.1 RDD family protein [Hydromonas duriensis]